MTIVESIKCVLQNNHSGLTSKQIYDEIIRRGLYIFGAENPVGVVNAQLRRRCAGLDFPTAYPVKSFEIAGYEGKKIKFRLLSEEKEVATITAPKIPDSSELLPEEKIKSALQEHEQKAKIDRKDTLLKSVWIPIAVTILTSLILNGLESLYPLIRQWLSYILK